MRTPLKPVRESYPLIVFYNELGDKIYPTNLPIYRLLLVVKLYLPLRTVIGYISEKMEG